jgi:hypothetical protein
MMFAGNFAPRGWAFCDGQGEGSSNSTADLKVSDSVSNTSNPSEAKALVGKIGVGFKSLSFNGYQYVLETKGLKDGDRIIMQNKNGKTISSQTIRLD